MQKKKCHNGQQVILNNGKHSSSKEFLDSARKRNMEK